MGIVKFTETFSINKIGSIAEFDNELCDKLIERKVAVEASESDIKADEKAKESVKKQAEKNNKKAIAQNEKVAKLHKPMNLQDEKIAIAKWRAKEAKKKK